MLVRPERLSSQPLGRAHSAPAVIAERIVSEAAPEKAAFAKSKLARQLAHLALVGIDKLATGFTMQKPARSIRTRRRLAPAQKSSLRSPALKRTRQRQARQVQRRRKKQIKWPHPDLLIVLFARWPM